MKVMRVDGDGEPTYEVRGMTEDQAEALAALADFPLWGRQPKRVAEFCAALFNSVADVIPNGALISAEAYDMTFDTTVETI